MLSHKFDGKIYQWYGSYRSKIEAKNTADILKSTFAVRILNTISKRDGVWFVVYKRKK